MNTDRQLCAVCRAPIRPGLLMCAKHWRLVPDDQQLAVVSTYGAWCRHTGGAAAAVALIAAYRTARDAAVASVFEAIKPHATGELL